RRAGRGSRARARQRKMRILISAGGTGGGVYPALAIAKLLRADFGLWIGAAQSAIRNQQSQILWVGGLGGVEKEIVERAGLPFKALRARGVLEALGLVRHYRPKALLVTGGFVAAPVALAAWINRVAILVYVPDI